MTGGFPLKDSTSQKVLLRTKEQLVLPPLPLSQEIQECVVQCLAVDASKRISVKEILDKHFVQPFIKKISDQVVERNR